MYGCGQTFLTFHFIFSFGIFFLSFCVGAAYFKIWSKVGGELCIGRQKNVVIKEALSFEIACFFLAFYKNWLPFDLLYGFHCFRSCFVSFKHGLRCGPNGSSLKFLLCKLWVANSQWRYQRHCLAVIIAVSVCLFLFVFRLCLAGSFAASALRRHCVGPALALRRPCVGPASALRRQCVCLASALRRPCVGNA